MEGGVRGAEFLCSFLGGQGQGLVPPVARSWAGSGVWALGSRCAIPYGREPVSSTMEVAVKRYGVSSFRAFLVPVAITLSHAVPAIADDIALGRTLYAEHCAVCHGAELEGAPDWKTPGPDGRLPPPPHDETGHTWHHGDAMLFAYTRLGGQAWLDAAGVAFDSGMLAFGDVLSDDEIRAILAFIRSTWPARIQEYQAARTAAEREE